MRTQELLAEKRLECVSLDQSQGHHWFLTYILPPVEGRGTAIFVHDPFPITVCAVRAVRGARNGEISLTEEEIVDLLSKTTALYCQMSPAELELTTYSTHLYAAAKYNIDHANEMLRKIRVSPDESPNDYQERLDAINAIQAVFNEAKLKFENSISSLRRTYFADKGIDLNQKRTQTLSADSEAYQALQTLLPRIRDIKNYYKDERKAFTSKCKACGETFSYDNWAKHWVEMGTGIFNLPKVTLEAFLEKEKRGNEWFPKDRRNTEVVFITCSHIAPLYGVTASYLRKQFRTWKRQKKSHI